MSGPAGGAVVVTGGAGFLGAHLVAALQSGGRAVRVFDRVPPRQTSAGVEVITGSVNDRAALDAALDGASGVIHAAAIAHLWTRDADDFERVNADGTAIVADAALRAGIPMVHVSSFTTLVGRDARDGQVLDESAEIAPDMLLGPYPRSKRLGELAVMERIERGLHASIVLPSAPVGPGDHGMTPPSVMIRDLAAGKTPALIDCLLNMVDARALAEGIVAALDRGVPGRRYLLAGEDLSMRALAGKIAEITGVSAPRVAVPTAVALLAGRVEAAIAGLTGKPPKAPLTGVRLAARRVRFDAGRARAELGFAPPPIERALGDAIEWMRAEGHLPAGAAARQPSE